MAGAFEGLCGVFSPPLGVVGRPAARAEEARCGAAVLCGSDVRCDVIGRDGLGASDVRMGSIGRDEGPSRGVPLGLSAGLVASLDADMVGARVVARVP